MGELRNCVVLHGKELVPHRCNHFRWEGERVISLDLGDPISQLKEGCFVVSPTFCNAHTHMGDSCLPDGATGLTLEQGFFRPNGYKYRELGKRGRTILPDVVAHLEYMAKTGTTVHMDFRELGLMGAEILREASDKSGVDSVILSQFAELPFTQEELRENSKELSDGALKELVSLLKISDGFSESTMNDLTDPAWEEIRAVTSAESKMRAIHCLENDGYRDLSLEISGVGDLKRALDKLDPDIIVHLTVANAEEIELLAKSGKTAVLNPRANANLGLPLPPIRELIEAGVNLALGTDNGMLNSPSMLAELDFTYKVAKSQYGNAVDPDPAEILKMATVNVHEVLGDRYWGYLDEGAPADFMIIDYRLPHLRHTDHILASLLTRVTPPEVIKTYRRGRMIHSNQNWVE